MFQSISERIMYVMLSKLLKKYHSKHDVSNDIFCSAAKMPINTA